MQLMMKQKLLLLLLFILSNLTICEGANKSVTTTEHKHNKNIKKYIYHVNVIFYHFTTEDKQFFEKNSMIAALDAK